MDAFIGEVRLFPYNFIPEGWLPCNGQLLNIPDHQALYVILGFSYGGDGKTKFALPNLNGRVSVGIGDDPTDTFDPTFASNGGSEQATITLVTTPSHSHALVGANLAAPSRSTTPAGNYLTGLAQHISGTTYKAGLPYTTAPDSAKKVQLNSGTLSAYAGAGGPHENRQPVLGISWAICLESGGVWPPRPD
jgi:microcystin-dependent protein